MSAVSLVASRRLAHQWRGLVAAGVLLGLGFGLCLASLAAARKTASAYERILLAAEAPDAAVAHHSSLEDAERSLRTVEGITAQRAYAGFRGIAEGVDPVLTTALLAPAGDRFPLELPVLRAGRLPEPDAPDEVFVNDTVANGADLEVGQRLTFHLFTPGFSRAAETTVTIVGTGTIPVEAVSDETMIFGVVVFTRAFYEEHHELTVYSASNVFLAPGFDARGDLAPAVGALGHDLQSARSQERDAINEALRPLVIVLVALGALAFLATAVAAGQVIQRNRDRGNVDRATLRGLGMVRSQVRHLELATSALTSVVAVGTALLVLLLASPVAPIGPLHDLDPVRGLSLDMSVAAAGSAILVLTISLLTIFISADRIRPLGPSPRCLPWLGSAARGPAAIAGLTLAWRTDRGRPRAWRPIAVTTAPTILLTLCATFVLSAVTLIGAPSRYGFDADLIALNAYGDQPAHALARAFGDADEVVAGTGFTSAPFLLNGRAVPGLAATAVKGELTPTIVQGRPARAADEIVVGTDTLHSVGASLGDVVQAQVSAAVSGHGEAVGEPVALRVVGLATFPPVSQVGADASRLGTGALVTREAFLRMGGDPSNAPEFTTLRLVEGTDPSVVIARLPDGFHDAVRTTTTWFTGAKPAEIRQLDAAMPYLLGSLVVGYIVLFGALAHALWTRACANRHDLSVLQAVGCTDRQLSAVTTWQAFPVALAAIVIGIPVGIVFGRWTFTRFAQSLAVVDDATTTFAMVAALAIAVAAAIALAILLSVLVARRVRPAVALREG